MVVPTRQEIAAAVFSPRRLASTIYRAEAPHMSGVFASGRLFGGQAVSQAFRTIQEVYGFDAIPQRMHYRFIGPGKVGSPIEYTTSEYGDAVRILSSQNGKIIGSAHCVLGDDPFPTYLLDLDYILPPDDLVSLEEIAEAMGDNFPADKQILDVLFIEMKPVEQIFSTQTEVLRNINWFRIKKDCQKFVPTTCGLQVALLFSDFFIMKIAQDIYSLHGYEMPTAASLTHSVRFHKKNSEIDPYGWFLFRIECESLGYNRSKLRAVLYDIKREAVLTITQEAYCQAKRITSSKI